MLKWRPDGTVASRQLYNVDPNPREANRDISKGESRKADELQADLLAHLKSTSAETPADIPRRKRPRKEPKKD